MQNLSPTIDDTAGLLERRICESVTAACAGPRIIAEQAELWFVERGYVDVFLVAARDAEPVGARVHWFTAQAGQLLPFPRIDSGFQYVLLAVPSGGARYRVLERTGFDRLLAEPLARASAARMIDALLTSLAGITRDSPPKGSEAVHPGVSSSTPEATSARFPKEQGLWLEVAKGEAWFMGHVAFPCSQGISLPMPGTAWITLAPASTLVASDLSDRLEQGAGLLAGLEALLLALFSYSVERQRQADAAELARLQSKSVIDRNAMADALDCFVNVLGDQPDGVRGALTTDRLLGACKVIGRVIDTEFRSHAGSPENRGTDPVKDIADASGVRSRSVALKGRWWHENNGPLLVFEAHSNDAFALLPNKHKGYDAIDPMSGARLTVDEEFAGSLAPFAYVFFRSLPRKKLALGDIVRFASFGIKRDLALVGVVGLAGGLLGMAIPIASGHLFDSVFPAADRFQLLQIVLVLFIAGVVALLFEATRSFATLCVEAKASNDLQAAVWDRVLGLPVPFFRDMSAGDLAMRINGVNDIRKALSGTFVSSVLSSLFSVCNVVLLFFYSATLAIAAMALVTFAIGFNLFIGYMTIRISREARRMEGEVSGLVFEYLNGIAKLRVTGSEGRAFTNWATRFGAQKRLDVRSGTLANISSVFGTMFPVLANTVIFLLISSVFLGDETAGFSTGAFIAFSAAFVTFLSATLSLVRSGFVLLDVVPTYERAKPILEAVPEVDEDKAYPGTLNGAIELSNVSFAYDPKGPLILDDVSISIRPGEFVALVGSSGSGKSTLLRLMLGFEKAMQGGIYYDGHNIDDTDIGAVRRQLGVVLQSGRLIGGDIFKNIVGSTTRLLGDAWEAARSCGLDEDIAAMPMGMHTLVNGGTISGGQRQRILIARAIVNKPRIIFFDEATSALDNRTQATVSASIEKLRATRVVIAHRLSTIMNADRIYVLEKGKLLQSGTYKELMDQDGLFAELAKRQLA